MGQIFLVRHGQASFGAADYDCLSTLGVEQARLLGGWLAGCGQPFGRVVTGSLKRHRQTAEACVAEIPAPLKQVATWHMDPAFDEYDHNEILVRYRPELTDQASAGRLLAQDGNPKRAFQRAFAAAMERWMSGRHDGDYRESWTAFRTRCTHALRRLVDEAGSSQTAIVFTSGGPISAICQELLGLPDPRAAELNWSLVNSAVTRVLYQSSRAGEPQRVSLSYLNSFPHLERTGQPTHITYR